MKAKRPRTVEIQPASRSPKSLPFATPGRREAGVLLHVSSLPGGFGIGDLGPAAFEWVDLLAAANVAWWQILPLGPPGGGNSPYQCLSAFAGNPQLISPEALADDGLLRRDALPTLRNTEKTDFAAVAALKDRLLRQAFETFKNDASSQLRQAYEQFAAATSWLADYAIFISLRERHALKSWADWPKPMRLREPAALERFRHSHADAIAFQQFVQFIFYRQLDALRTHCHARGVGLIGDAPIFVAYDSADVWTHPHLFKLDTKLRPKFIAGVPPDAFSATGQRWSNPLYDWDAMARDGYAWWVDRLRSAIDQTDAVRLDHFRGFDAYWQIPASAPTAMTGRWVDGPGLAFFEAVRQRLGHLPIIAEDLGVITPRVEALRDTLGLAGMRVIQFGFGGLTDSLHLPHHFPRACVAYTGTHDNDTTAGWFKTLTKPERERVARYTGQRHPMAEPVWELIRLAWSSVAALAVVPAQDLMELPSSGRMNTPGTAEGNWGWRLTDFATISPGLDRLCGLSINYARV